MNCKNVNNRKNLWIAMELYLLRYFLAVVETGSFTKAAQSCYITQPTLSAGIKRLEEALGVQLFIRNNKRVFLTEAGTKFMVHAKRILHECNQASLELSLNGKSEIIRLGVLRTIPIQTIANLIEAITLKNPQLQFELFEGSEQELTNRLDENGIDYAITISRKADANDIILFKEKYTLALSKNHIFANEIEIEAASLKDEHMIVRSNCEILSETSRHFTDNNVRPRLVYRTNNDERALAMVGAGIGITIMPESYSLENVVRIPMKDFNIQRETILRTRKDIDNLLKSKINAYFQAFFR